MEVKKAVFVESNSDWSKCPKHSLPEFAFIGRSNVGKSSLINKLTNQRSLAKTSSTPGKTLLINHFLINGKMIEAPRPKAGERKQKPEFVSIDTIIGDRLLVISFSRQRVCK